MAISKEIMLSSNFDDATQKRVQALTPYTFLMYLFLKVTLRVLQHHVHSRLYVPVVPEGNSLHRRISACCSLITLRHRLWQIE